MARPKGIAAHNIKNEVGNKYGRLTVVAEAGRDKYGRVNWECLCECGKSKIASGFKLRGGLQSCGCLRSELTRNLKLLSDEERARRAVDDRPCSRCHEIFPPSEFRSITDHHCRKCKSAITQIWRLKDENGRRFLWRDRYGIEKEDYERIFEQQDGKCAICRELLPKSKRYFQVDHDHDYKGEDKSSSVRGLLCGGCNTGLGLLGDNLESLSVAVEYLRKYYTRRESS